MGKIQVYCAVSIDGYIAGLDNDLSWLEDPETNTDGDTGTVSFEDFMSNTGAMLMGRRTFDVVMGFGIEWPYGTTPVMVATNRPLGNAPPTVSACSGTVKQLCSDARKLAGDRNVYVDGGQLITQAIDAGCIDELILTIAPVMLGSGVRLYQGRALQRFRSEYLGMVGTMMQVRLTPTR